MDCHSCKCQNLPEDAFLSSRNCTERFRSDNKNYQSIYQSVQRLKKKKQGVYYKVHVNTIKEILTPHVNDEDAQRIIDQIKVNGL